MLIRIGLKTFFPVWPKLSTIRKKHGPLRPGVTTNFFIWLYVLNKALINKIANLILIKWAMILINIEFFL